MDLSSTDLATLKAAILADPVLAALPSGTASAITIAKAFNADVAPVEKAWRSQMPAQDLDEASDITAFDGLSAGKRDAWMLFLAYAPRDFTRNKVRKVVTDIWGASNAANTVAFAIYSAATRNITRAEKLFGGSATATEGSGAGVVTAKRLSREGEITPAQVEAALLSS